MKEYIKPSVKEVTLGTLNPIVASGPDAFDEPSTNPSYGKRKVDSIIEDEDEGDYGW